MPVEAAVWPRSATARAAGRFGPDRRGAARHLTAADVAPRRPMQALEGLGAQRLGRPMSRS